MIFDSCGVENKIGYSFKDKMLLRKCFTHSSFAHEHGELDNERLEFFGDAILEFVVTEYLYKHARGDEGDLTQKRAKIVSKEPLLKAFFRLDLKQYVLLGAGARRNVQNEDKLYSSVYEALVAGIYLDGGIVVAKKFIKNTLIDYCVKIEQSQQKQVNGGLFKSRLQEFVQKEHLGSITYETLAKSGPDHKPFFRVAVCLNGSKLAEGSGSSKKMAESKSAELALQILQN